jgi:hypothetical protein
MPKLAQLLLRNDLFYRLAASKALAELTGAESGLRQGGSWLRETEVDCCVGMEDECYLSAQTLLRKTRKMAG